MTMMFGRKKRPSQLEGGQAPDRIAQMGAADDDDDIIELIDIIEIPEDHEAEDDLLGLSDVAMDADYPSGASPGEMDDSTMAAILENEQAEIQAEILEVDTDPDSDVFLTSLQERATAQGREFEPVPFEESAFDDAESVEGEDLETEETLLEEADTDQLISELMGSQHDEETEEGAVLVEEYEETIEQPTLGEEDHDVFKDWDTTEVLTDLAVEREPAGQESDEGLIQLLEGTFGQDLAPAAERLEMPVEEVGTTSVAVEQVLEDEAPVSAYQEEPDVDLMETAAAMPAEARLVAETQDAAADVDDATVMPHVPFTLATSSVFAVIEPVFTITSTSPVLDDSMTLEEEILFATRTGDEVVEGVSQLEIPSFAAPGVSPSEGDPLSVEDSVPENVLNLDTFLPIAAARPTLSTAELDLLDLVEDLETRLLASLQVGGGPDRHEVVGSSVKEELEELRRLIDHIDATDDFRL
jgi:hypothetical protein